MQILKIIWKFVRSLCFPPDHVFADELGKYDERNSDECER